MVSEESSERSELRAMQREQERERRRMRDRQRRQTMTIEQRENHLARRRRNYQLRRQKFGTSHSDSQPQLTSIASILPFSDLGAQCDTTAEQRNCQMILGNEATTCKLDELPKSLRLNHIRHIARSLNNPGANDGIALALTRKEKESTFCQLPTALRLSNVKRLARGLNSITKPTIDHIPENAEEEEQIVTQSEIKLLRNDTVNSAQIVNNNGQDEQMSGDSINTKINLSI